MMGSKFREYFPLYSLILLPFSTGNGSVSSHCEDVPDCGPLTSHINMSKKGLFLMRLSAV
jgi:hypothetical protein